jgi:putative acetyltransferase
MKATLRKFENEDTPVLLKLFYDTVHSINAKDYAADQLDAWAPEHPDLKKWQRRFKASTTVVAELDGKVVGFGNLDNTGKALGMLYVHKDHQNQRVATGILDKLEGKLLKHEVSTAAVESSLTARSFFEKRGYTMVRENRKMLNGRDFVNLIMEKKLSLKPDKSMKEKSSDKLNDRSKPFKWRDLFVNKVFDLMIVIVGVSVAFQLNNLKLEKDQVALERFYYESLIVDIDQDIEDINKIVTSMIKDQRLAKLYADNIENEQFMLDSAGTVFLNLMALETFSGNQSTYLTLVSGNGLSSLGDREIRRQITDYYSLYDYIDRFEKVHTELIFKFLFFLSPHFDLASQKIVDPTIIRNIETKNFVGVFSLNLTSGIDDYRDTIEKAQKLKAAVSAKLK